MELCEAPFIVTVLGTSYGSASRAVQATECRSPDWGWRDRREDHRDHRWEKSRDVSLSIAYSFLGPFATPYPLQYADRLVFPRFKNLILSYRGLKDRYSGIGDSLRLDLPKHCLESLRLPIF